MNKSTETKLEHLALDDLKQIWADWWAKAKEKGYVADCITVLQEFGVSESLINLPTLPVSYKFDGLEFQGVYDHIEDFYTPHVQHPEHRKETFYGLQSLRIYVEGALVMDFEKKLFLFGEWFNTVKYLIKKTVNKESIGVDYKEKQRKDLLKILSTLTDNVV